VLPNFVFKPIFGSDGHATVRSALISDRNYKMQTGWWERMLCKECEQIFSPWESYASKFLSGTAKTKSDVIGTTYWVRGLDYELFKLFQMSVLWRASVSRHRVFAQIDLGKREEDLRKMLINRDPGEPHEFGCWMTGLVLDDEIVNDTVVEPTTLRLGHMRVCVFVFGGVQWLFGVSREPAPGWEHGYLRRDGSQPIIVRNFVDVPALFGLVEETIKKDLYLRIKSIKT
jgi:hypothetical protein